MDNNIIDYEKIIMDWNNNYDVDGSNTLNLILYKNNDFFSLLNYILLCQKNNNLTREILNITCPEENVYRIKHFLYLVKDKYKKIYINNNRYEYMNEVNFFGILPLIEIDKNIYDFLAGIVSDYFYYDNGIKMCESDNYNQTENVLKKICINSLYTHIDSYADLSDERIKYFSKNEFYKKIEKMPILAFLLFCIYDRVKHEDIAKEIKDKIKSKLYKNKYMLKKSDAPEAYPSDEEVVSDLFNVWDIADGLLQLIENVVEYACDLSCQSSNNNKQNGKGVISIRIHKNDLESPRSFLKSEFNDYFEGYENVKTDFYGSVKKDATELEIYKSLNGKAGLTLEEMKIIENILSSQTKRKKFRAKIKHFLDVRVFDASGRCMTDVFKDNLQMRGYSKYTDFCNISVRGFFDPNSIEQKTFEEYYQKENLIYHYGLQIFSSVILNNDGCFYVRSGTNDNVGFYSTCTDNIIKNENIIAGTRYHILLPFRTYKAKATAMINSNISYYYNTKHNYIAVQDAVWIKNIYEKLNHGLYTGIEKEQLVLNINKKIVLNDNEIPVFDISKIKSNNIEILCKAIILHITSLTPNDSFNCAIINCESFNFISIIRIFAVCYDKNGKGEWMKNSQIYLCGNDTTEEFLISGESISILLQRVEKLAFSRKVHPDCLNVLRKMLKKRQGDNLAFDTNLEEEIFEYTPFDLLIENKGCTLFEKNVGKILQKDIQESGSGCKIEPIHARLGSKIHIDVFFEAELLFYNNYYTNRFAYLMMKRITKMDIDYSQQICFVGYETYSEMLLCEMKRLLDEYKNIDSTYVIYEVERDENDKLVQNSCRIRYLERMEEGAQIVFVVPINTTLTTFNKLHAALGRENKNFKVLAFMGVVQIRDIYSVEKDTGNLNHNLPNADKCTDLEREYWDVIDTKNRAILSRKLLVKPASYQVCVRNNWENPLVCKMCFPDDVIFERPLIETDKASVVPTQLIGLKGNNSISDSYFKEIDGAGTVESLKNYFYCDHIYRGDNHYKYYIRTAKYVRDLENQEKIRKWLEKVGKVLKNKRTKGRMTFDIIVNPMHFSSTTFVELVNDVIFNGASYVLRIESEKEFRDNILAKYSDLRILYDNLKDSERDVDVNFHYVDDNIITGKSFNRVKHLIDSLFPYTKYNHININIFSDIIVLINRLSVSSIHSYISDVESYYSFINLKISSLRNHGDACFLCKNADDAGKLADYASTNIINDYWLTDKKSYTLKSLKTVKEDLDKERQDRNFELMLHTHMFNLRLDEKKNDKNDPLVVYELVIDMINEAKADDRLHLLQLYLEIISNPFSSYRKSIRECALQMIIILLEMLIEDISCIELENRVKSQDRIAIEEKEQKINYIAKSNKLKPIINKCTSKKKKEEIFLLLIRLSVELKSNYIIRGDRIEKIVMFINKNSIDKEKDALFLISQVKKLISLSSDEAKGTYIEKELNEYFGNNYVSHNPDIQNDLKDYMFLAYYMENTRGLYDAVVDLSKIDIIDSSSLNEYYFQNYRKILKYNSILDIDNQINISKKFKKLYIDLDAKNQNEKQELHRYIKFYNIIAKDIKDMSDLEYVYFLISRKEKSLEIKQNGDVDYSSDIIKYDIFSHSEQDDVSLSDEQKEVMYTAEHKRYLDTFYIEDDYAVIILKKQSNDNTYFQPIYLFFKFKRNDNSFKYRIIRWCLMYRNKLVNCFEKDFNNNIIQNWIETSNIMKHMRKARAFLHARDEDDNDEESVWVNCKKLFYGRPCTIKEKQELFKNQKDGFIIELMTDIRLGRINMLLLSDGDFHSEDIRNNDYKRMEDIEGYINAIDKAYFWRNVEICSRKGIVRKEILDAAIRNALLEKNKYGKYSTHNEYLVYLIYEALHSAERYGACEEDGKVHIQVYKDKQFLCIKNKVDMDFDINKISAGLARKGNGISLATICEFIIREYENRRARIKINNNEFLLAIPIFKE